MTTTVQLLRIDASLDLCRQLLIDSYHSNEHGCGWYHRLATNKPGPTATALGLHFFDMRGLEFPHREEALAFLKRRQVRSTLKDRSGGWAINTSFGLPVVEATAWVTYYLADTRVDQGSDSPSIEAAYEWLSANQNPDGGWGSIKDQPSRIYLTALALRSMLRANPSGDIATAKAITWLFLSRTSDGRGWGSMTGAEPDQTHTAMALLALVESAIIDRSRLRTSFDWLRESYDPDSLYDARSKIESYNVEATVASKTVTWHNSLPHYSAPFSLLAIMADDNAPVDEPVLRGVNAMLDQQENTGSWPNIEGGHDASIWSVWTFAHALNEFRRNPLFAGTTSVRAVTGLIMVYPSVMTNRSLSRLVRSERRLKLQSIAKRHWATGVALLFAIAGLVITLTTSFEWKDYLLGMLLPILLLFLQEAANRGASIGGRNRGGVNGH